MDSSTMLQASSLMFLLTALGGVVMAAIRFVGHRNPPSWLAMAHGLLAAAGLTLLVYAALMTAVPGTAVASAVLFVVASAGGVALNLVYHLKGAPLPTWLTLAHAVIAVGAFALLLYAAYA